MTMQKKLVLASLVIVAVIAGIMKFRGGAIQGQMPSVWVKTAVVQQSTLPVNVRAIGTLTARSVEISPEISGHVQQIHFADGAMVKKDEALIQLDDAVYKAKYESAKARLAFNTSDYNRKNLLATQGVIAKQAIEQAMADLKTSAATAEESAVMVSKMQLVAPFDGVVGRCKVNPGDYVTTGQSMVSLTDTKHLRIEYNVPESFLPLLKRGQEVQITAAAWPGKTFTGKVSFISPTINAENRSIALYADVANEENELAAGMFANIKQVLGKQEQAIMIPSRSLVPVLDGEQVFTVKEGKAYAVNVTIGKRQNEYVQILQGLKAGDVIITDGQLKVRNGMPVQIK